MITITAAQLDYWLAMYAYPLSRVLGFVAAMPVFNNVAVPAQIRVLIGLAIGLGLAPVLPAMPAVPVGSWLGLAIVGQQALIGLMMGFAMGLVFAAIDIAGDLIGLQMGLSFAVFYDPNSTGQTPVLTEFLSLFAALVFLALNGHLVAISALAESFRLLPVSTSFFAASGFLALVKSAAVVFSIGLMLALPVIAALLITNIALGVLSRVAPTLNLFAVGFPVTMAAGFSVLALTLPLMGGAFESIYDRGFALLTEVLRAGAAHP